MRAQARDYAFCGHSSGVNGGVISATFEKRPGVKATLTSLSWHNACGAKAGVVELTSPCGLPTEAVRDLGEMLVEVSEEMKKFKGPICQVED